MKELCICTKYVNPEQREYLENIFIVIIRMC